MKKESYTPYQRARMRLSTNKRVWRIAGRDSKGRRVVAWDFGDTLEEAKKSPKLRDFVSVEDEACFEVDPDTGERITGDLPGGE